MTHPSWGKITFLMLTKLVRRKAGTQEGRQEEGRKWIGVIELVKHNLFQKNIVLIQYVIFYHNVTHLINIRFLDT